jgi:hypothetical protein
LVTTCVGSAFKHVIGIKLEGMIEFKGRRGRRRKQLLNDLKETKRYCKSSKDALGRFAVVRLRIE